MKEDKRSIFVLIFLTIFAIYAVSGIFRGIACRFSTTERPLRCERYIEGSNVLGQHSFFLDSTEVYAFNLHRKNLEMEF